MVRKKKTMAARIHEIAEQILEQHPEGMRYTHLWQAVCDEDPTLNESTVQVIILKTPGSIQKLSRGLYIHANFGDRSRIPTDAGRTGVHESDFYKSFAEWMERDLEEVTKAVPLGGKELGGKWGTPDVIGKKEGVKSDIFPVQMEMISAEIKTNRSELVTAFGQACAYCLFSHRSYVVVPKDAPKEEIDKLTALCQVFGIGLVVFDTGDVERPDYSLVLRARRQEPDYRYLNECAKDVEDKLFK